MQIKSKTISVASSYSTNEIMDNIIAQIPNYGDTKADSIGEFRVEVILYTEKDVEIPETTTISPKIKIDSLRKVVNLLIKEEITWGKACEILSSNLK